METQRRRPFPADFLFGAATAAYQIEGATFEEGRTASIWDEFCRRPGSVVNEDSGLVASDHHHRFREDVALMTCLGLQAYRFSASWARVRPDGGPPNVKGLAFYDRLVDELLTAGIRPWLTIYHWDLPQRLHERGGWTSRDVVGWFAEYALTLHDALGDRVWTWTTLNEPWASAFVGHLAGEHAPGHQSPHDALRAAHHLLLAHGVVVDEIRRRSPGTRLGITLDLTVADPVDSGDPADVDAARRLDGQHNRWLLDPIFRGAYPHDIVSDLRAADAHLVDTLETVVRPGDLEVISRPIDVLGVNYYHGALVGAKPPAVAPQAVAVPVTRPHRSPLPAGDHLHEHERGLDRTAMGWEVQPEGLTRLLSRVHAEYCHPTGTEIFVTENGAAFEDHLRTDLSGHRSVHDVQRSAFLYAHLDATLDAREAGVKVSGYFAWSLLDNFEWAWGYAQRFGLIHVDYATLQRTIKDSGTAYAKIIESRSLPPTFVPLREMT